VVPSLQLDNGTVVMQSMAIIEYLEGLASPVRRR
jgi:glutathione S-transferase